MRGKGACGPLREVLARRAGSVLSRGKDKRHVTLADHRAATEGVELRNDECLIDEAPATYKDVNAAMETQRDLVDVGQTLKQVVRVKR